ncbi:MAG: DeoR/GlpR family DNA-binding transcription regulator [Paracoccaceae bacterium]
MHEPGEYATHREVELLETLRSFGGTARTTSLAETLKVSEETVRRTIKSLAKTGAVRRVHGGVYLVNSEATKPVASRLENRAVEKTRIAEAAAALIPNQVCVFLDVGSTTAHVAQSLRRHNNLTVVTNGLLAAQSLVGRNGNRVFLAGGELHDVEGGAFGPETSAFVSQFNIDIAVLSVDGIDERGGFLLEGSAEAGLARAVAAKTRRVMVVADQAKFGVSAPIVACDPTHVDVLVTDKPLNDTFNRLVTGWDVELIVTDTDGG